MVTGAPRRSQADRDVAPAWIAAFGRLDVGQERRVDRGEDSPSTGRSSWAAPAGSQPGTLACHRPRPARRSPRRPTAAASPTPSRRASNAGQPMNESPQSRSTMRSPSPMALPGCESPCTSVSGSPQSATDSSRSSTWSSIALRRVAVDPAGRGAPRASRHPSARRSGTPDATGAPSRRSIRSCGRAPPRRSGPAAATSAS